MDIQEKLNDLLNERQHYQEVKQRLLVTMKKLKKASEYERRLTEIDNVGRWLTMIETQIDQTTEYIKRGAK